ncbi:MAG: rod shape-determining protein MreC [Verrucomicrobiaceae bacterium]|nr:rod shape-determining protein MreC [Verrucomicrobiaceae bacterium]
MAATIAVLTLDTPTTRAVQAKVLAVFAPFIHASGTVQDTTSQAAAPDIDPKELLRYNEQLKLEVAKLKILSQRHDELLEENNRLREMAGYKMRAPFKQLIAAHVIKRSAAMWWNTLIIDKGSEDGIEPDRAVLTDAGLVGKTGRVTANMAEVVLLTDELCRVAAMVEGTREKGILSGERGAFTSTPDLRLRFLSRNGEIAPGMNVLSSGDGGVFPAKLLLGRVKVFENKDIAGEAVVEPAVDFSKLEDVFVVGTDVVRAIEIRAP